MKPRTMKFRDLFGKGSYDRYAKSTQEELSSRVELAAQAGKDGNAHLRKELLVDRACWFASRICPITVYAALMRYLCVMIAY